MSERIANPEINSRERALGRINELVDAYVKEASSPMTGWGSVETKDAINNPEKLKSILGAYALLLLDQGKDPEQLVYEGLLPELARLANVCESDFSLLEETDPKRNCVMYGFEQLDIPSTLNAMEDIESIKGVLNRYFTPVADESLNNVQDGDLLVLHTQDNEQLHVGVIEVHAGKVACRSKLGSLWVVRNSDIRDLFRYYHADKAEVYRKK